MNLTDSSLHYSHYIHKTQQNLIENNIHNTYGKDVVLEKLMNAFSVEKKTILLPLNKG